jgi:hypothetical protein
MNETLKPFTSPIVRMRVCVTVGATRDAGGRAHCTLTRRPLTLFSCYPEHSVSFVYRKQRYVFVVDDELRVLESVVNAYEVFDGVALLLAEVTLYDDVKDVSRSFVISRVFGFAHLSGGAIQLPVDSLQGDKYETSQSEHGDCCRSLNQQRPSRRLVPLEIHINRYRLPPRPPTTSKHVTSSRLLRLLPNRENLISGCFTAIVSPQRYVTVGQMQIDA